MTIQALRVSFVFTETILDVQRGVGGATPLAGFITEPGYIGTVDALQKGIAAPLDLRLPWPYPAGQHFWDGYLHERQPGDAKGKLCFKKIVPLRLPKLAEQISISPADAPNDVTVRAAVEGFFYPHGTGLLITATLGGAFDIEAAGRLALQLRYDKVYGLTLPGKVPAQGLTLNQLATRALDRLREAGFGGSVSGIRSEMFSIATVLRGDNVDPNQPVTADGPSHRLLNCLSGWVKAWRHLQAPALQADVTQLRLKTATRWPGDILFATKRGRAVWLPGRFGPVSPPVHWLACYHRNLALGSMQTESLLMLAAAVEEDFAQPALVSNAIQKLGRNATGLLARLHSGIKTYRSDSLRAQIIQSAQLGDVNALRQRHAMDPIP